MTSKKTSLIDAAIGSRLRLQRMLRGLTQGELGAALGLSFQQIQKYEQGINRITAGRLFDAARILGVPVIYFYEGGRAVGTAYRHSGGTKPEPVMDILSNDGLLLLLAYMKVKDVAVRKRIFEFVCSVADASRLRKGRIKRGITKTRHAA